MLQEVIKIFYTIRKFLGIVQYDATNGLNVAGTPVSYETVTYAQFVHANFDLTTARHVIVTDKHSTTNSSDACGSLWWIEPTNASGYKRVLRSAPIYYSNLASGVSDWPYATYPAMKLFAANIGNNGAVYQASSTGYRLSGYYDIIRNQNVNSRRCVFPAATWDDTGFTMVDPGSGGNTRINSTGASVHGLTQSRCITAGDTYVYVSAGTGWTVGWYKIVNIDSLSGLTLDTDSYNSNVPTISLVGGVGADIYSATLPRYCIGPNGQIDIDTTFGMEGTITAPDTACLLNSTQFNRSTAGVSSTHTSYAHNGVRIRNNGAYNSQIAAMGSATTNNANQNENGQTTALATGSIDFSAADVALNIRVVPGAADNVFWIRQLVVRGC